MSESSPSLFLSDEQASIYAAEASRLMYLSVTCKLYTKQIQNILDVIQSRNTESIQKKITSFPENQEGVLAAYDACESFIHELTVVQNLFKELADCARDRLYTYKPIWDMFTNSNRNSLLTHYKNNAFVDIFKNVSKWDANQIQQALQPLQEYEAMKDKLHERFSFLRDHDDFDANFYTLRMLMMR